MNDCLTRRFRISVDSARLEIPDDARQPEFYAVITYLGISDSGVQKKTLKTSVSKNFYPTWPDSFIESIPLDTRVIQVEICDKAIFAQKSLGIALVPIDDLTVFSRTEWYPLIVPTSKGCLAPAPPPMRHFAKEVCVTVTPMFPKKIFSKTPSKSLIISSILQAEERKDAEGDRSWIKENMKNPDSDLQNCRMFFWDDLTQQQQLKQARLVAVTNAPLDEVAPFSPVGARPRSYSESRKSNGDLKDGKNSQVETSEGDLRKSKHRRRLSDSFEKGFDLDIIEPIHVKEETKKEETKTGKDGEEKMKETLVDRQIIVPNNRLIECFFVVGLPRSMSKVISFMKGRVKNGTNLAWNSVPVGLELLGVVPFINSENPSPEVALFCVPDGARLSLTTKPPSIYPITFTSGYGFLRHSTCLLLYEPMKQSDADTLLAFIQDLMQETGSTNLCPPLGTTLYAPKCYCVQSHFGASLTFQREWLHAFYNVVNDEAAASRMIEELLTCVPGRTDVCMNVTLCGKHLTPIIADCLEERSNAVKGLMLPGTSVPFSKVMSHFRPAALVELFCTMMLESQVVLVSSEVTMLEYTSLMLRRLLYPFNWYHLFIPVCSENEFKIPLMSDKPFIVGVTPRTAVSYSHQLKHFVCYDLDHMHISFPSNRRPASIVMPAHLRGILIKDLKYVMEHTEVDNTSVQAPFLRFFLNLLADFPLFLLFLRTADRVHPLIKFEQERFIWVQRLRSLLNGDSQGRDRTQQGQQRQFILEQFLEAFMKTQCFTSFVDFYPIQEPSLFNRLLMSRKGVELVDRPSIADLIDELHSTERQQLEALPRVSVSLGEGFEMSSESAKSSFPLLDLSRVLNAQRFQLEKPEKGLDDPSVVIPICTEYLEEAEKFLVWRSRVIEKGMKCAEELDAKCQSCRDTAKRFWAEVTSNGKLSDDVRKDMLNIAKLEPGRVFFGRICPKTDTGISLKKEPFSAVVEVFQQAVRASQEQKELAPVELLDLLFVSISCVGAKGVEELTDYLKNESYLHNNLRIWDSCFCARVNRAMRSPSLHGDSEPLPALLLRRFLDNTNVDLDEELEKMEDKMLFDEIAEVALVLTRIAAPHQKVNSFFINICQYVHLKPGPKKELQKIIETLIHIPLGEDIDVLPGGSSESSSGDTWDILKSVKAEDLKRRRALLQSGAAHNTDESENNVFSILNSTVGPSSLVPLDDGNDATIIRPSQSFLSPLLARKNDESVDDPFVFPMSQLKLRCESDAKHYKMTVLRGHTAPILCLDSFAGKFLVSGGCDNSIRLWSVSSSSSSSSECLTPNHSSERLMRQVRAVIPGKRSPSPTRRNAAGVNNVERVVVGRQSDWVKCLCVVGSKQSVSGTRLLSGSYDSSITLWDMQECKPITVQRQHKAPVVKIMMQPKNEENVMVSGSKDGKAFLWDMRARGMQLRFDSHKGAVTSMEWFDDDKFITGAVSGFLCLWDIRNQCIIQTIPGHTKAITSIALIPRDSQEKLPLIVSAGADGLLLSSDMQRNKHFIVQAHDGSVNSITYSQHQRCLASAGSDGIVRTWHPRKLHVKLELSGHGSEVSIVQPFRHYFVSCGADGSTRMWNPKTAVFYEGRSSLHNMTQGAEDVRAQGYCCSEDASRELENQQNMDVFNRHFFIGHKGPISCMCNISDSILATAGWDSTVQYTTWK